jgi:uncharacterized protein (TIGR02466 family)
MNIEVNEKYFIDIKFPTAFYVLENSFSEKDNNILLEKILDIKNNTEKGGKNWLTDVYNTEGTFDIVKNKDFNNLCDTVTYHTNKFAKILESDYSYDCVEGWLNFYYKNDYQEYHTHPNYVFSAVYFFTNPKNSGKLIFENPIEPDMCGLKNISKTNVLNGCVSSYFPKPRTLIIFRSYLRHMVTKCQNTEPRITAAFNLR